MAVADAWREHEWKAFARLTDAEVDVQVAARETLHDFIVTYREMAKEVDDRSVYDAAEWLVVAGLELLFQAMFCEAVAISSEREEAREE